MTTWNRETYESSFTRNCFSFTPFCGSVGWDARWGKDGPLLRDNAQIRQLVEMECAVQPVPLWAQQVARQIDEFPPCGWSFPQQVEAVSTNIGRGNALDSQALRCFSPGPERLAVISHVALLLDGWLKDVAQASVAGAIARTDSACHAWPAIVARVWDTLGAREPRKVLLVRRLLERLRFWLRAPYAPASPDRNPSLGYLYVSEMSSGGWGYFDFELNDPVIQDLDGQIEESVDTPRRWLEVISCTWPCAPKVLRFLERIIWAIGRIAPGRGSSYDELQEGVPTEGRVLPVSGTHLTSEASRLLYDTAISALAECVGDSFALPVELPDRVEQQWKQRLVKLVGEIDQVQLWLTSLLLVRIVLFEEHFRSFHFTRHANHQYVDHGEACEPSVPGDA